MLSVQPVLDRLGCVCRRTGSSNRLYENGNCHEFWASRSGNEKNALDLELRVSNCVSHLLVLSAANKSHCCRPDDCIKLQRVSCPLQGSCACCRLPPRPSSARVLLLCSSDLSPGCGNKLRSWFHVLYVLCLDEKFCSVDIVVM